MVGWWSTEELSQRGVLDCYSEDPPALLVELRRFHTKDQGLAEEETRRKILVYTLWHKDGTANWIDVIFVEAERC